MSVLSGPSYDAMVDAGVTSARATFERACRRLFELGGPSPENMAWCENRAREIQVEIAARRARVAAAPDSALGQASPSIHNP